MFFGEANDGSLQNTLKLISTLRSIIESAPNFVPARSDLAGFAPYLAPLMPAADAAAVRAEAAQQADAALRLQPDAGDAYAAKEMLLPPSDLQGREALLRRALSLDPNWASTNMFLAFVLQDTGRMQEAAGFAAHAVAGEPRIDWRAPAAWVSCDAGQYEPAITTAQRMYEDDPDDPEAQKVLGTCLWDAGRYQDALAALPRSLPTEEADGPVGLRMAMFKAMISKAPADHEAARRKALAFAGADQTHLNLAVQVLATLGYVDDAFRLSDGLVVGEQITETRPAFLFTPRARALRKDPRFLKLVDRLGLLTFWRSTGRWPDLCSEPGSVVPCTGRSAS